MAGHHHVIDFDNFTVEKPYTSLRTFCADGLRGLWFREWQILCGLWHCLQFLQELSIASRADNRANRFHRFYAVFGSVHLGFIILPPTDARHRPVGVSIPSLPRPTLKVSNICGLQININRKGRAAYDCVKWAVNDF